MVKIINDFQVISSKYEAVFCDLWGCIHNGKESFKDSIKALLRFRNRGGKVILLTNAPRPQLAIIDFLNQLKITKKYYDAIVTSGDATQLSLQSGNYGHDIFHIGPSRDLCIFDAGDNSVNDFNPINLVEIAKASCILCTGLFNDQIENPDDYKKIINQGVDKKLPLLCANPDIQVDYGHQRLWCAGAIANNYRKAGGKSIYFGKPHKAIYDLALKKLYDIDPTISKHKIICIGDGIKTDILGGNSMGLDTLFVSGGLADKETGTIDGSESPDKDKLKLFFQKANLFPTASIGFFR